jgi:hypothetical protein
MNITVLSDPATTNNVAGISQALSNKGPPAFSPDIQKNMVV